MRLGNVSSSYMYPARVRPATISPDVSPIVFSPLEQFSTASFLLPIESSSPSMTGTSSAYSSGRSRPSAVRPSTFSSGERRLTHDSNAADQTVSSSRCLPLVHTSYGDSGSGIVDLPVPPLMHRRIVTAAEVLTNSRKPERNSNPGPLQSVRDNRYAQQTLYQPSNLFTGSSFCNRGEGTFVQDSRDDRFTHATTAIDEFREAAGKGEVQSIRSAEDYTEGQTFYRHPSANSSEERQYRGPQHRQLLPLRTAEQHLTPLDGRHYSDKFRRRRKNSSCNPSLVSILSGSSRRSDFKHQQRQTIILRHKQFQKKDDLRSGKKNYFLDNSTEISD